MYTSTIIASLLAGLTAAAPLQARDTSSGNFFLTATHSGSPIHLRSINASGQKFWINRAATTYCPAAAGDCSGFNNSTTILSTSNTGTVSLDVTVPGGQQVYISGSDKSLSFTAPHSASAPPNSVYDGFTYAGGESGSVGSLTHGSDAFYACPANPANGTEAYQIFVGIDDGAARSCLTLAASTATATAPYDVAAWEYV